MNTIQDYITANPQATDAEVLALYHEQAPEPRTSNPATTYVTYLSLDAHRRQLFGEDTGDIVTALETGLQAWIDGVDLSTIDDRLPPRGRLRRLHSRLAGEVGVDMSDPEAPGLLGLFASGVPGLHAPLLTTGQAMAMLAIGYVLPEPKTPDDVQAARRTIAGNALLVALETYASDVRTQVNQYIAGEVDTLPEVPT